MFHLTFKGVSTLRSIRFVINFAVLFACVASLSACNWPTQGGFSRAEPPLMRGICVPPNERELQILQTAANAISLDDRPQSNSLSIGAMQVLGYGLYSRNSKTSLRICTPEKILDQVGSAIAVYGLAGARPTEYEIQLAVQLPNPSDRVIQQVGNVAFNASKQHSSLFFQQDIRPMARSALARFGVRAVAFSDVAVREMNSSSSMGTGAAQVAAAIGHPAALPWITREFNKLLGGVPTKAAIPIDTRDRLLELAWAIYFAGDAGRSSAGAIHRLMARKVESRAPPFGIVEIWPKSFCRVLELIEGQPALEPYAYCVDDSVPFEQ